MRQFICSLYAARGIVTDTPLINGMQSVLSSLSHSLLYQIKLKFQSTQFVLDGRLAIFNYYLSYLFDVSLFLVKLTINGSLLSVYNSEYTKYILLIISTAL